MLSLCAVCRSWDAQPLCRDCRARFAPAVPRCTGCGLRMPLSTLRCAACLAADPAFERVVCGCDYVFPWDRLVTRFKFHGQVELAGPLAALVAEAVERAGLARPDLVVPVPLAPGRLAERGYNQAWELARRIARRLKLRAEPDRLQRPVDGPHQAGLTLEQRRRSLRGSIMPNPARRENLSGRRVALVDDVMTSGATLAEAAAALRRAGAAQVDAWVLARTPAPDDV